MLRQLADGQAIRKVALKTGVDSEDEILAHEPQSRISKAGWREPCMSGRDRVRRAVGCPTTAAHRGPGFGAPPPEGRARWTARLLAEEAVSETGVGVGREMVRICSKATKCNRGGKKMWCVAELDEEYIVRMEDVLAVYEKPLSVREPVVCIDDKPVVLHQEVGLR